MQFSGNSSFIISQAQLLNKALKIDDEYIFIVAYHFKKVKENPPKERIFLLTKTFLCIIVNIGNRPVIRSQDGISGGMCYIQQ